MLGCIAASGDRLTRAVTDAGAVAPMASIFKVDDFKVQKIVAQGLANISAFSNDRDEVFDHDLIAPLLG